MYLGPSSCYSTARKITQPSDRQVSSENKHCQKPIPGAKQNVSLWPMKLSACSSLFQIFGRSNKSIRLSPFQSTIKGLLPVVFWRMCRKGFLSSSTGDSLPSPSFSKYCIGRNRSETKRSQSPSPSQSAKDRSEQKSPFVLMCRKGLSSPVLCWSAPPKILS